MTLRSGQAPLSSHFVAAFVAWKISRRASSAPRRNGAGLCPCLFCPPHKVRGGGAPKGATTEPPAFALAGFGGPRPERRARRLSALHRGDFCSPGPRFLVSVPVSSRSAAPVRLIGLSRLGPSETHWNGPSPAGSLRSGRSAARSGPEASRCRGYEPQQRAPHPPRVSQRPAGTPLAWGRR